MGQLLDDLDADELPYWLAYYGLEPWGQERDNLHAGMIAATVANCNSSGRKFSADDFMLRDKPEQQSPQDIRAFFERLAKG